MKLIITNILVVLVSCSFICDSKQMTLQVSIKNPNNFVIEDGYIELSLNDLENHFVIKDGNDLIPYQIEQSESDGKIIGLVLSLKPNEEKVVTKNPAKC